MPGIMLRKGGGLYWIMVEVCFGCEFLCKGVRFVFWLGKVREFQVLCVVGGKNGAEWGGWRYLYGNDGCFLIYQPLTFVCRKGRVACGRRACRPCVLDRAHRPTLVLSLARDVDLCVEVTIGGMADGEDLGG